MFRRAHEENCKQAELERKKAQKAAEKETVKAVFNLTKKNAKWLLSSLLVSSSPPTFVHGYFGPPSAGIQSTWDLMQQTKPTSAAYMADKPFPIRNLFSQWWTLHCCTIMIKQSNYLFKSCRWGELIRCRLQQCVFYETADPKGLLRAQTKSSNHVQGWPFFLSYLILFV